MRDERDEDLDEELHYGDEDLDEVTLVPHLAVLVTLRGERPHQLEARLILIFVLVVDASITIVIVDAAAFGRQERK